MQEDAKVAKLQITVMLKDPDGVHKYETFLPYGSDEELVVLPSIALAMVRRQGGFIRMIDGPLHINIIPYERMKDAEIEVFPEVISTNTNVGAAAQEAQQRAHAMSVIKGGKAPVSGGIIP